MALYISENEMFSLAGVEDAIAALEAAFAGWGTERVDNAPRQRIRLPQRAMNLMGASWAGGDVCGHKAYFGGCHYVALYSISEKKLLAMIEAGMMGAIRTGAASGVATRHMAREDAKTLGVIGTGRQARTQILAIAAVRELQTIRIYGRDETRRNDFAAQIGKELSCAVEPAESGEACVRGVDVAVAATNASEPVILGEWLAPGIHVNAIGANAYARRELDDNAVARADIIVTDQRDQARMEARELIDLTEAGRMSWNDIGELGALVSGEMKGRTRDGQITLFKSLGLALEDIAFAKTVYERALEKGVGSPFGPDT